MKNKKRVGLFLSSCTNYMTELARGARQACKEKDAELVIFFGGALSRDVASHRHSLSHFNRGASFLYANELDVDMLLIPLNSILQDNTVSEDCFLEYFNCPIVILGERSTKNYSSVRFSNKSIKDAVNHLIKVGERKNIAIIADNPSRLSSNRRILNYKKGLEENNIEFNEDYILHCKNASDCEDNQKSISDFIDQHPEVDAYVCNYDDLANCLYRELKKRDISIGKDVLVTSFNDDNLSSSMVPPLASCHTNPSYLAYAGIINGLDNIDNDDHFHIVVPTHFIARTSSIASDNSLNEFSGFVKDALEANESSKYIAYGFTTTLFINEVLYDNTLLDDFTDLWTEIIENVRTQKENNEHRIRQLIENIFTYENSHYIDIELLLQLFFILSKEILAFTNVGYYENQILLTFIYSSVLHCYSNIVHTKEEDNKQDFTKLNHINKCIMEMDEANNTKHRLHDGLQALFTQQAVLYTYPYPLVFDEHLKMDIPNYMDNRFQVIDGELKENTKLIETPKEDILDIIDSNYKVISCIYFNNQQFGILVSDTSPYNLTKLDLITSQFGIAISMSNMLTDLHVSSITDPLTGLMNRRGILSTYDELIEEASKNNYVYLLLADIDFLKLVNDRFGHSDGDNLIKMASRALREVFGSMGSVGRFGGDEFVVLFKDYKGEFLKQIPQKLQDAIDHQNNLNEKEYSLSLSYGISVYDTDGDSVDFQKLLSYADQIMYEQKIFNHKKAL